MLLSITSGTHLADQEFSQVRDIISHATGKRASLLVSVLADPLVGNEVKVTAVSIRHEQSQNASIGATLPRRPQMLCDHTAVTAPEYGSS